MEGLALPLILNELLSFFDTLPAWIVAITTLVTGASALVNLTPTKKDDEALGIALKVLNWLALNFKAK